MPIYDEKYGQVGFDTALKTIRHCQNSQLHFQMRLRSENSKKLSYPKKTFSKPKKEKPRFWVKNKQANISKMENLVIKIA